MYVCLCVCQTITFESLIFAHAVCLQGMRVEFVYEGHLVKVKVTGATKVANSYSRNLKLRSVLSNIEPNG